MSSKSPVLETVNLKKHFARNQSIIDSILRRDAEKIRAVDDVSISLERNESIGIIGESGCGKTTLLRSLIGLYEPTAGEILFNGKNITNHNKQQRKEFLRNVQLIFQDPFNSLNPKMTVREALLEPLNIHNLENKNERIYDALKNVELSPPERYLDNLPRHLSGGEKQRVSIARALITNPDLILADEPVSMLDVSTQAAILNLLSSLMEQYDTSLIYISHDLSTVTYVCDSVKVMYLGRIVESAPTKTLLTDPQHPYTEALLNSIPIPNPHNNRERASIPGSAKDPVEINGCRFKDRCPERMDICDKTPRYISLGDGRQVACHLHDENRVEHEMPVDSTEDSY